jgi:mannose-6-phosphate isomerase-like protein (cupin superfamily)
MNTKVNLAAKFATFTEAWNPKIIGDINDFQVKLAKLRGAFDAHRHVDEDEMFLVIAGSMRLVLPEETVELGPGEMFIVPKGTLHRPIADDEAHVLLIEPASTLNTGDRENERTRRNLERI